MERFKLSIKPASQHDVDYLLRDPRWRDIGFWTRDPSFRSWGYGCATSEDALRRLYDDMGGESAVITATIDPADPGKGFVFTTVESAKAKYGKYSREACQNAEEEVLRAIDMIRDGLKLGVWRGFVTDSSGETVFGSEATIGRTEAEQQALRYIQAAEKRISAIRPDMPLHEAFDTPVSGLNSAEASELARIQYTKLKEHVLRILKKVTAAVEADDFKKVEDFLAYSCAGDGYGGNNYFINFAWDGPADPMDILQAVKAIENRKLETLAGKKEGR